MSPLCLDPRVKPEDDMWLADFYFFEAESQHELGYYADGVFAGFFEDTFGYHFLYCFVFCFVNFISPRKNKSESWKFTLAIAFKNTL